MLMEAVRLFHRGGFVMYPLLLCSISIVAIALERFRYYRGNALGADELTTAVSRQLKAGKWDEALQLCEQTPGAVARVLAAGLRERETAAVKEAFESATAWEAAELRKYLGYLDLIVTMSPLLGLLGTVVGMIGSFSVFDAAGGNPAAITGGVGEALVATAAGLGVAILALTAHSYFCHRLDLLITAIERGCAGVVAAAKDGRS